MTDFVDYVDAEKVLQADVMEMQQQGASEERIAAAADFIRNAQASGDYTTTVRHRHQMILDGKYVNGRFVDAL